MLDETDPLTLCPKEIYLRKAISLNKRKGQICLRLHSHCTIFCKRVNTGAEIRHTNPLQCSDCKNILQSEHCKGLVWRISARAFKRFQKIVQCERSPEICLVNFVYLFQKPGRTHRNSRIFCTYVCVYVYMYLYATIKQKLQVIMMHMKRDTIQFDVSFKAENVKRKRPLVTVAGIALKGQGKLISTIVPLDVLLQQQQQNWKKK